MVHGRASGPGSRGALLETSFETGASGKGGHLSWTSSSRTAVKSSPGTYCTAQRLQERSSQRVVFRVKMFQPKSGPQYTPRAAATTLGSSGTASPRPGGAPRRTVSSCPSNSKVYTALNGTFAVSPWATCRTREGPETRKGVADSAEDWPLMPAIGGPQGRRLHRWSSSPSSLPCTPQHCTTAVSPPPPPPHTLSSGRARGGLGGRGSALRLVPAAQRTCSR